MTLEDWMADFTEYAMAYHTDPNGHENFFNWCCIYVPRLHAFAKQAQEFIKLEQEFRREAAQRPYLRPNL